MSQRERRTSMALDDAYEYCRSLEKGEKPEIYRLCASLRTVDAALESAAADVAQPVGPRISLEAWSRIRNTLFDYLLRSFNGYFLVYRDTDAAPVEPGMEWPEHGLLEFFPEQSRRREDSYLSELEDLDFKTMTSLRWCFAEGRQTIRPADFANEPVILEEEVEALMERFNEVCEEEATRGKKRAHQKWWQLYWESNSCHDNLEKRRLHKDMDRLQTVWGRPS